MRREKLEALLKAGFTKKQAALIKKHGTPAEFAQAVYASADISLDEARAAVNKYNSEWQAATGTHHTSPSR